VVVVQYRPYYIHIPGTGKEKVKRFTSRDSTGLRYLSSGQQQQSRTEHQLNRQDEERLGSRGERERQRKRKGVYPSMRQLRSLPHPQDEMRRPAPLQQLRLQVHEAAQDQKVCSPVGGGDQSALSRRRRSRIMVGRTRIRRLSVGHREMSRTRHLCLCFCLRILLQSHGVISNITPLTFC
jgi:hypothetical protein